jgi:gephyrin
MSTGNELVDNGAHALGYGQVRDANRPALMAAIEAAGFTVIDLGMVHDNESELQRHLSVGFEQCHAIVTTGGVSMGDMDLLKTVIERRMRGHIHFGRVDMKPGKPTTFATIPRVRLAQDMDPAAEVIPDGLLFALPGNPVSALVTLHVFTLPALRKMAGHSNPHALELRVKLAQDIKLDSHRPEFHRAHVHLDGGNQSFIGVSTGDQRSSRLASMKSVNALLKCPPVSVTGAERLHKGDWVDALVIGRLE